MEHGEVNKAFTIKCSYSLNAEPEGYMYALWSNDSKKVATGLFRSDTALLSRCVFFKKKTDFPFFSSNCVLTASL